MIYVRSYVSRMSDYYDSDLELSGYVYRPEGSKPSKEEQTYLAANLYIEEVNADEGRWLLILDRSEYVSDDLEYLESLLTGWATNEYDQGFEIKESA